MSVKWTQNQQKAIDSSGSNILVSAAAGSGKTAVLVQRVIRMITAENPVRLDRILMVTFTNAAAAEMRTRIYKAITECIERDPENKLLHDQLALLSQAQITTIHAFCQNLLRDNFYKADVSPDFTVIDETDAARLIKECAEEVTENAYADYPEQTERLAGCYGGRFDDEKIKGLISSLYKFIQCKPEPEKWLSSLPKMYKNGFGGSVWQRFLSDCAKTETLDMLSMYGEAIEIAKTGGVSAYIDFLAAEKNAVAAIMDKKGWDEIFAAVHGMSFDKLPRKNKDCDGESAKECTALRNKIKKQFSKLCGLVPATESDLDAEIKKQADLVEAICRMTADFSKLYGEKKRSANTLDFDDMLHFTLERLLGDEECAASLAERFDEILVDEYQDTNAVNIELFTRLSNGKNLFAVGDVKQSIYGFLNARPESFTDMYYSYSEEGNEYGMKIPLSNNFRSAENILDFVNCIFEGIMTKRTGGVLYTGDQRLVYSNKSVQTSLPPEIHILEEPPADGSMGSKLENEAFFTAKRILELVEVEKPLIFDSKTGESRPVCYGDIAVLARSVKSDTAVSFVRQLALCGVPVTCDETGSYFMTVEISAVISFLQIIDNPMQDIPMLAVMRSPMFSFTENELAAIRIENKNDSFCRAVLKSEMPKAREFCRVLEGFSELSKTAGLELLIERIITDTGYFSFVGRLPGGERRTENLKLLCRRAGMFEQSGRKSIFEYITYINAMLESGSEYKTAKTAAASDNSVKIMTIHKSKGLEFPCVFLTMCGKRFAFKNNLSDVPAVFDPDLGIGLDYVDMEKMIKYPSIPKLAVKKHKLQKEFAEEMRVLYVALTRAKNYLCIVGTASNPYEKKQQWMSLAKTENNTVNASSPLEWICTAAANICDISVHDVQDVMSAPAAVARDKESIEKAAAPSYNEIDGRLSYTYKYAASNLPSKASVSELIHRSVKPSLSEIRLSPEDMTPADKGTIMHFAMQKLDLSRTSYDGICAQVGEMVQTGMLTETEAAAIDCRRLADFFASDTGMRIKRSANVKREYSFCVYVPASELFPDVPEELILVQGAVDCFFEEDGELVIVDYKTGKPDQIYQKQLDLYSLCLKKLMKKTVKEAIISEL